MGLRLGIVLGMVVALGATPRAAGEEYRAGVARVVITPDPGLWMAGYASRNQPAEGKLHDLYAKALALEDAKGQRLVLVTTDLIGFPRSLSVSVAEEVERTTGLPRAALMLTASHTHCGPVLRDNLMDMYEMPPDQLPKLKEFGEELQLKLVKLVREALADLKPARLRIGQGTARFAVNRRKPTDKGFINAANPDGPVDHDVPVLEVATPDGKLRAVVFGYACHNTTLQFLQWCGDYAGFAQAYLEERYPGTTAMFWSGCGADANPLPRSTVELCQKYGKELADAVAATLKTELTPVTGPFKASYVTISLAFDKIPTKNDWAADMLSKNYAVRARAARYIRILESGGKLEDHYQHYPIQAWRLGDRLRWLALGGEVVVDYSHHLKRELGKDNPVWVTAYANDVMAYIPSLRVLKEGGYEGDSSMIGYGLPTKWAPEIEEKIMKAACGVASERDAASGK